MTKLKTIIFIALVLTSISLDAQNKISLRYVSLGGDGLSIMPGFELLYSRSIIKGLDFRIGYSHASKSQTLNDLFSDDTNTLVNDNFITPINESENPVVEHTQYKSYNLGLSKLINASLRSDISLYVGARYEILNSSTFTSSGPQLEFINVNSYHGNSITYELDLSYNYRISETSGFGGSFFYSSNLLIFAGTLGVSVYFK